MKLSETLAALKEFKAKNPTANKADVETFFASMSDLTKARSVYSGPDYAI